MRRGKPRKIVQHSGKKKNLAIWLTIIILIAGIAATVLASQRLTNLRSRAVTCDDQNCNNIVWSAALGLYMIKDCNVPTDPDGHDQVCMEAGQTGICQKKTYCCPGNAQKWTSDMSSCPVTPTITPYPTYTPYPSQSPYPTYTKAPVPTAKIVYRYITPKNTSTPKLTATPTLPPGVSSTPVSTPVLGVPDSCDKSCKLDSDCKSPLVCVYVSGYNKACRGRSCQLDNQCQCEAKPLSTGTIAPIATPSQNFGSGNGQIPVSVSTFTDSAGNTNEQFTLTGRTDPGANVTVSILPDGVNGQVLADASGKWTFPVPKKLTAGAKQLLIIAAANTGSQGQLQQSFNVIASKGTNIWGIIFIILVIGGLGFGAYVYLKSQ